MDTIRLGKTDLTVTRIGFGGIPIQRLSEKDAISVVRRCVDLGINFLDTANAYSNSEERIGKAISGRYEGLIIATKSGARNPDRIKEHLEQSLKMLQVDSIDLYQLHAINDFDAYNQVMNERLDTMEEAKRVGKIKHIGITSHNIDVAKEAVKSNRFETLMFPFNFITSEPEDQLLPLCKKHDVGFIAMKPMGGGMLEDATIAFKYLLQFPDVVPIPGIEHLNEIDEIVEVVNGPRNMTEAEIARMQQLKDELGTQFCRRCDYCRPCSVDIPISTVMVTPSFFKRLPPERIFSSWIGNLLEKAALCTKCGECEKRCPYDLPIREKIEEYSNLYQEEKHKYEMATAKR